MNDIYTFQVFDSYGDGWSFGSGYTLIQDDREMDVEMEMLSSGATKPMSMSTVFSSCLLFQVEYTKWKVRQSRVSSNWNTVTFDDSAWSVTKAAGIPSMQYPTTYIRKSFELTGIEDYTVMIIRIKWEVWLCISTETDWLVSIWKRGITPSRNRSPFITLFSKFHIILSAVVIVEGTNELPLRFMVLLIWTPLAFV